MPESAADIPALLARLHDQNDAAAQQLGLQLGTAQSPEAAAHLIAALDNPERRVRWAAAVALGFIAGWPSARALINTALRDGAIEVRARAQEALRTHRETGVREMLLAALVDESAAIRKEALIALSLRGESEAVEPIVALIRHSRAQPETVLVTAIRALTVLSRVQAVQELPPLLADPRIEVRVVALSALGSLHNPTVLDAVLQSLEAGEAPVRLAAAVALEQLCDPRAVGPLSRHLSDPSPLVRERAARGLGVLRARAALGVLNNALQDPELAVRFAAVQALEQIADLESVPRLIETLKYDRAVEVRGAAALSLGGFDISVVPALIQAYDDPEPEVRFKVVQTLGTLRDQRAWSVVQRALRDPSPRVWPAAEAANKRLRSRPRS